MTDSRISRVFLRIVLATLALSAFAATASAQYSFYAITPCRAVDTRGPTGTNGGPVLGTTERDFQIKGVCGVPTTAKAVSINLTITQATADSFVSIWPSGQSLPGVSTINFDSSYPALANGAIVGLSANTRDLAVKNNLGNVHVIIDVTGYFQ